MTNHISWLEFVCTDGSATSEFYSGVFGWKFQQFMPGYSTYEAAGGPGGGFRENCPAGTPQTVAYIEVESIDEMLPRIEAAGGKVVVQKFQISPDVGLPRSSLIQTATSSGCTAASDSAYWGKQGEQMPAEPLNQVTLSKLTIRAEYKIDARPERVWLALTRELTSWWGAPYLCCDDTSDITLDLRGGGALVEHGADGSQVVFGTVSGFTPNQYLELDGTCGMRWPSYGNWSYTLTADGDSTTLSIRHDALGIFDEATVQNYGAGWDDLMGTRLKSWVEGGTRLGLGHEPEWVKAMQSAS